MQSLACCVTEILLPLATRTLSPDASLESRFTQCKQICRNNFRDIPRYVHVQNYKISLTLATVHTAMEIQKFIKSQDTAEGIRKWLCIFFQCMILPVVVLLLLS